MRYFFLAYALLALLVVGLFGVRGQKSSKPPIMIFPDMDRQDKLRAQRPEPFFADGQGSRQPVAQTVARGFNREGAREIGGIPEYEFTAGGYYGSGRVGDYFGNGMPEELGLKSPADAEELIRRGEERYNIHCAICHGPSGDGKGITTNYGVPAHENPNAKLNAQTADSYPDGRLFNTITHGMGRMGAYGTNIAVRDRWAIIAYVRTLQAAKQAAPATK